MTRIVFIVIPFARVHRQQKKKKKPPLRESHAREYFIVDLCEMSMNCVLYFVVVIVVPLMMCIAKSIDFDDEKEKPKSTKRIVVALRQLIFIKMQ